MSSTMYNDVLNAKPNEGFVCSCVLYISWSGRFIHGQSAQHHNTYFQCGSA